MDLIVYSGAVELMHSTLNGVAMLFDTDSALPWILGASALIGLFIHYIQSWSDPNAKPFQKWVYSLIATLMLGTAPIRVEIVSMHSNDSQAPMVVDNVPAAAAIPAWFFSGVKYSVLEELALVMSDVDHTGPIDPLAMMVKFNQSPIDAYLISLGHGYDNFRVYIFDCVQRDIETFPPGIREVDVDKMALTPADASNFLSPLKVTYQAWTTKYLTIDGDGSVQSENISCPDAFAKINAFFESEKIKEGFEDVMKQNGVDIHQAQVVSNYMGDKLIRAPISMWQMKRSAVIEKMVSEGLNSDTEIAYSLQMQENINTQNNKDILQSIFSAENTAMFILLLELLTVIIVPVFMIITLMTGKLESLLFGGNFAFTALVTSIMYMPMKMMMLYFYVNEVGSGVPSSWVQMGSTIDGAESAVARASALTLMIPALISLVVNKLFQGASSTGSALSAANKMGADVSKVAPTISSGADAGSVSSGNTKLIGNTAAGNLSNGHVGVLSQTTGGSNAITTTVGNGLQGAANRTKMQADERMEAAQAQRANAKSNLVSDILDYGSSNGTTTTNSANLTDGNQALYNTSNNLARGDSESQRQVLNNALNSALAVETSLGSKILGSGGSLKTEESQNAMKAFSKEFANQMGWSEEEAQANSASTNAMFAAMTKVDTSKSTGDSGGINKSWNELQQASQTYQSSEKDVKQASAAVSHANNIGSTSTIDNSLAGGSLLTNKGALNDLATFVGGQGVLDGLNTAWQGSGFQGSFEGNYASKVAQKENDLKNDNETRQLDDDQINAIAQSMVMTEMLGKIGGQNQNQSNEDLKAEQQTLAKAFSSVGDNTGHSTHFDKLSDAYNDISKLNDPSSASLLGLNPKNNTGVSDEKLQNQHKEQTSNAQTERSAIKNEVDGTKPVDVHSQNQKKVADVNSANEAKVGQSVEESTTPAGQNQIANQIAASVGSHNITNDENDHAHLQSVERGLNFLSQANSGDVTEALKQQSTDGTSRDIFNALGAIGQQSAEGVINSGAEGSERLAENMNVVKDYLSDNKEALVAQVNNGQSDIDSLTDKVDDTEALSRALVANDGDTNYTPNTERAAVESASGENINPGERELLKSFETGLNNLGVSGDLLNRVNDDANLSRLESAFGMEGRESYDSSYFDGLSPNQAGLSNPSNAMPDVMFDPDAADQATSNSFSGNSEQSEDYYNKLKDVASSASRSDYLSTDSQNDIALLKNDDNAVGFMTAAAERLEAGGFNQEAQRLADTFGFELSQPRSVNDTTTSTNGGGGFNPEVATSSNANLNTELQEFVNSNSGQILSNTSTSNNTLGTEVHTFTMDDGSKTSLSLGTEGNVSKSNFDPDGNKK